MTTKIYTDGASRGNPGPAAGGIVVGEVKYGLCFGITTNNIAEYRALLYALREAINQKVTEIEIFSDSLLLVNQVAGVWRVNNQVLLDYQIMVRHYLDHNFKSWTITHIPRELNTEADKLANKVLDAECEK